jgi:hypothetical protein
VQRRTDSVRLCSKLGYMKCESSCCKWRSTGLDFTEAFFTCRRSHNSTTHCRLSHGSTTHCRLSHGSTTHCRLSHGSTTHCRLSHRSTTHCRLSHSSTTHCRLSHSSTTHALIYFVLRPHEKCGHPLGRFSCNPQMLNTAVCEHLLQQNFKLNRSTTGQIAGRKPFAPMCKTWLPLPTRTALTITQ